MQVNGQSREYGQWVLLEPTGSLGNRLAAYASARLLASDLGRELVLDWRPSPECGCSWQQLMGPMSGLRLLGEINGERQTVQDAEAACCRDLDQFNTLELPQGSAVTVAGEAPAIRAGVELLRFWCLVRRSAGHSDLIKPGLERLNRLHATNFRAGLAYLLDPSSPRWQRQRRGPGSARVIKTDLLHVQCVCVSASDSFYPSKQNDQEMAMHMADMSIGLSGLNFAPAIRAQLWPLCPGTISVHVPRSKHNAARHAFSPVQMLELEMNACRGARFFLATDDPAVEKHLQACYAGRLDVFAKRSLDRAQPSGVEEALVDLLMLSQGDRIIGTTDNAEARIAAILGSKLSPIDMVFPEGNGHTATVAGEPRRAVEFVIADPCQPRGPFFLAGTWNDWKDFERLMPNTSEGVLYDTCVKVRKAPGFEEFQVVQSRDWEQRFYPSPTGTEILGPDAAHGANWRVKIPTGCTFIRIFWDPRGKRSFRWRYIGHSGKEWDESHTDDGRLRRSSPYSLVGSWDSWKEFADLSPTHAMEATYCGRVKVRKAPGEEEFQIVQDRDWKLRFYPINESLGAEVQGPDHKHGMNWRVTVPCDCRWLFVVWDPRGDRCVEWSFLGRDKELLPSQVNRSGPFSLVGSWDNWEGHVMMHPVTSSGTVCSVAVEVRPWGGETGFEEFLILQEQDWKQRFYPSFYSNRKILGPDGNGRTGQNWRVRILPESKYLHVTFDPRIRSLEWRCLDHDGNVVTNLERVIRRSAPETIQNWQVLKELGRGWAGGVVYRAQYMPPATPPEVEPSELLQLLVGSGALGRVARAALVASCKAMSRAAAALRNSVVLATPPGQGTREAGEATPSQPRNLEQAPVSCSATQAGEAKGGGDTPQAFLKGPQLILAVLHGGLLGLDDLSAVMAASPVLSAAAPAAKTGVATLSIPLAAAVDASRPAAESAPGGDTGTAVVETELDSRDSNQPHWVLLMLLHHRAFGLASFVAVLATNRAATVAAVIGHNWLAEDAKSKRLQQQAEWRPGSKRVAPQEPSALIEAGTIAAVKYPVPLQEIRILKRLGGIEGVPAILDMGCGAEGLHFFSMPLLGPSLEELLFRCNHDGFGGRISWSVARALGAQMVRILRDIHRRGIVHCDIKPGNVLVGLHDTAVHIIDFGLSGCAEETYFGLPGGTIPYNSIMAGFPGKRTQADDLESVGWVLLKCLLGQVPWERRDPDVSHHDREKWLRRCEGISLMKEWFLEDPHIFGEDTAHCPLELRKYLSDCRRLDRMGVAGSGHLATDWDDTQESWQHFVKSVTQPRSSRRTLYMVARGRIVWCHGPAPREGAAQSVEAPDGLKLRTTGSTYTCSQGSTWVELDVVWTPRNPLALAVGSWLLVTNSEGPAGNPLLVPAEYSSNALRRART